MPASRATAFDTLAPDQRAAVELVLRQGRSYGELSDLLGMPEETIRTRARGGLAALAPDLPAPARAGEIADWLLGQQSEAHAARTRELLLSDPAAHRWAATVATPLRKVPGGESVPPLPDKSRATASRARNGDEPPPATARRRGRAAPARDAPPRSSRLGGALLIGAAVVIVAAVLAFVFLRGDDDPSRAADTDAGRRDADARPRPPSASSPATSSCRARRARRRSRSCGSSRPTTNRIEFALVGQDIPPNANGERYSLWFRNEDGKAQLRRRRREAGRRERAARRRPGPGKDDIDEFPTWFQTYDDRRSITQDDDGRQGAGHGHPQRRRCPTRQRLGQQLAGVHDPGRIAAVLDRAQQLEPELADLVAEVRARGRGRPRGGA